MNLELVRCKRTCEAYVEMRDRHYVPNKGCHGQQLHYLIKKDGSHVGIISGASSVWAVKARDEFFGVTAENKRNALPSIVNNVVFRLEDHTPNLATASLSLWRRQIAADWHERYGVQVHGFETFVIENDHRKGSLYKADNWTMLGETAGRTKQHVEAAGMATKAAWIDTAPKLIFARRVRGTKLNCEPYKSTWRREKPDGPPQGVLDL